MSNDFSKFQAQTLTKPRDAAWENFAKFEKVGDKVQGILRDVFFQPAAGQFGEKRGFTLEQADGKLTNVAMKRAPYFAIRSTNEVRLGDLLTIELSELRKAKVTGNSPTKIFAFSSGTLPENATNPTVKELEEKDMVEQGVAPDSAPELEEEKKEDVPFN